ncbi:MAG: LysR family transcriptional regulator [Coriobacteriia bacterium]|nr:LysR family transcriptional regulator [Coriobacteriia bacterium]MBN2840895.1 LysR family transcriptional regulator [Coriobacteriia bacterium]
MNISQLKTFIAVVDHRSFSDAARTLGISQPAATMHVQSLESDVGATLFDRGYRKIGLTEAGEMLVPYARRILAEVDEAHHAIESMGDVVTGRITIAASTTPGQYLLPRILGTFLRAYPKVGATLRVYDSADVVEHVARGEADLGMTGAEVPGARVRYEPLGTDELVLICPAKHKLAGGPAVTFSDAAGEPFIVREAGSGTRIAAEEIIRRSGVDPADLAIVMELGTNEAIVSAVEGGMGLGIVSRQVAEKALELGTVALVPGAGFPVARPLFLVLPRTSLTRAADALADHLRGAL